ncbi:coenzyme F420-dependent NADP oxidoreductase [Aspergillus sclerotioniger CBS 115572]|uniref:Coenzyme F420-dependent NADP oxidoreductase n=1 Tax=Aspergillus sclerotioniger CBS 115572 TaxID=1450535 RepID=A0A317XE93_9EURO|nr:coenzyme F420-dependent NADP oxidoreductase [Aspergillus sclerotioniger CBS 115572]PWY96501.1 coenzyme F420-dependent NADP oxidoreductase [Aspergillus sclerotioniger CBS 115572]
MSTPDQPQSQSQSPTLAIIGCGKMGTAILNGLLHAQPTTNNPLAIPLPRTFIATTRSPTSLQRLKSHFQESTSTSPTQLTILPSTSNPTAIHSADIILLACDPTDIPSLLTDPDIQSSLTTAPSPTPKPKLLLSIAAGWTTTSLLSLLPKATPIHTIRALPNILSSISQSITAIELPSANTPIPTEYIDLTENIFQRIGRTVRVRPEQMDTFTVLGGSTPAFVGVFVEALVDGAVAVGFGREEARMVVAQVVRGVGEAVLGGEHPALLKERGTSPGGCTMGGLMVLEEGGLGGWLGGRLGRG